MKTNQTSCSFDVHQSQRLIYVRPWQTFVFTCLCWFQSHRSSNASNSMTKVYRFLFPFLFASKSTNENRGTDRHHFTERRNCCSTRSTSDVDMQNRRSSSDTLFVGDRRCFWTINSPQYGNRKSKISITKLWKMPHCSEFISLWQGDLSIFLLITGSICINRWRWHSKILASGRVTCLPMSLTFPRMPPRKFLYSMWVDCLWNGRCIRSLTKEVA